MEPDLCGQNEIVTCHLCVLNAHRSHQRSCELSTPSQPRCPCRPVLSYRLYPRYDLDQFLAHLKGIHLEYFERLRWLITGNFTNARRVLESNNDIWEVQKLIRETYGMGDDLM